MDTLEMQRSEGPEDIAIKPQLLINRELSWLAFNRRVLHEAVDENRPLLERVRFLSITASNLDEFFMVRYASLYQRMRKGVEDRDPSGMTPREQVRAIADDAHAFMEEQISVLTQALLPALQEQGIRLSSLPALDATQLRWTERTFQREILPALRVHMHRRGQPFPQIAGRALNLGMLLRDPRKDRLLFATAALPAGLPRIWRMPEKLGGGFICTEDIVALYARQLAPSH
ncbi:RNA degradosome polyphosphate kinase, partial [Eubacteriales bacterium OttesenSCG-928-A19]|nr:RNA degradosome polyphosphate kinase [Eubacteriales bacterium OttesenSCG-928-A19]